MTTTTRIQMHDEYKPVKSENKVVKVTKLSDGSLHCVQACGEDFTIPADETEMQSFVIFQMAFSQEL